MSKKKQGSRSNNALTKILHFTDSDLQANRCGHLSRAQVDSLGIKAVQQTNIIKTAIVMNLIGIPMSCAVMAMTKDSWWLLMICGHNIIGLQFIYLARQKTFGLVGDMDESRVSVVQGPIALEGTTGEHWINIQDLSFRVSRAAFRTLKRGTICRIYYAQNSMTLLSAEWPYDDYFD